MSVVLCAAMETYKKENKLKGSVSVASYKQNALNRVALCVKKIVTQLTLHAAAQIENKCRTKNVSVEFCLRLHSSQSANSVLRHLEFSARQLF